MFDHYRVETVKADCWAVVRFSEDGRRTVHMTGSQIEAARMRDELQKAEQRGFNAGLIVGHDEKLARPA